MATTKAGTKAETTSSHQIISPLSWREARHRLRETLSEYLKNPLHPERQESTGTFTPGRADSSTSTINRISLSIVRWIVQLDLDLWLGVLVSFCLLVISILLHTSWFFGLWVRDDAESRFPKLTRNASIAEIVGAGILFLGTVVGIFIARQRRYLLLHDSEAAKQRLIRNFLAHPDAAIQQHDELNHHTSLTGVFSVYRLRDDGVAGWSKLPSLLLVQGDWIALQVGDVTPSPVSLLLQCTTTSNHNSTNGQACRDDDEMCTIGADVELALHHIKSRQDDTTDLPKGRTTLQPDSEHLLELSNCLRIFRVNEPPLAKFLRQPVHSYRTSRLARRMENVRLFMVLLSLGLFVVSLAVVLARRAYRLIHVPFLVALSVLPVWGSVVSFFLEGLSHG